MSGVGVKVKVSEKGAKDSPSRQLGIRLPVQDFKKIQMRYIQSEKHQLFEDPYFPADGSSLFVSEKLPFTPKWLRPKDIVSKPKLYTGGASRFDVSQGMLGDCWLVAAIANLTQDKIMLQRVIPQDQSFDNQYCGAFHFRFWHFGEWVDIVVDDRLPTHNGKLIFIHSTEDNEFWSALLEKAYAKLYGSYEALKGGKTSEAMVDFTGGLVETIDFSKKEQTDNLYDKMLRFNKSNSFMSCSIRVADRSDIEAKLSTGLVKGHAYSITGVSTVTVKAKSVGLVRLRNPWGQKEWNGDWSDRSSTWKEVPSSVRSHLNSDSKEDGEFWMSFTDLLRHFTDMEICSVSMDKLYEDDSVKNWNIVVQNGSWEGDKAGGCRNFPTFASNPQYVITLDEDDDHDGKCSCLIALMQKNRRKQKSLGVQDLCIGFSIYKKPDGLDTLDKKYIDYHKSDGVSGSFTNAREVMARFTLEPGTYVIIPCSFKPGDEGEFLLRIFTEKASEKVAAKPGSTPEVSKKLQALFDKYAGSDGKIDVYELQDMLTLSFSSDLSKQTFSLDACRSMITMLDEDKNGTLDIKEFQVLLSTIMKWKKMFFKFDRDRSGTLEKSEIHSAIKSLGYSLSPEAFNILFTRFSVRNKYLKLDDFAACLSRVKIMTDVFEKKSNYKSDGSIQLSQDEFYKITLDA